MSLLNEAYIALLAGLTSYHPVHKKQILWHDETNKIITIEITDLRKQTFVVRRYWDKKGKTKMWEEHWQRDKPRGRFTSWYSDGTLFSRKDW